ncbi:MAG TPA: TfoX/Sxy family protein [Solirubrobacteraceae bacterium]|nr:TfoX/Sxy family protein [Solirubrobacteraceae bacterium]
MPYNENLAGRVREQLSDEQGITEKGMFGGLAFQLEGNMAVGVSGDELTVRVSPEKADDALAEPHARPFGSKGRPMKGWIVVAEEGVEGEKELAGWVARGVEHARSLPPKG